MTERVSRAQQWPSAAAAARELSEGNQSYILECQREILKAVADIKYYVNDPRVLRAIAEIAVQVAATTAYATEAQSALEHARVLRPAPKKETS